MGLEPPDLACFFAFLVLFFVFRVAPIGGYTGDDSACLCVNKLCMGLEVMT